MGLGEVEKHLLLEEVISEVARKEQAFQVTSWGVLRFSQVTSRGVVHLWKVKLDTFLRQLRGKASH